MDIDFDHDDEFNEICQKIDIDQNGLIQYENLYNYWKEAVNA